MSVSLKAVVHPTAVIEEGAVVGEDCRIGPYCIIGNQVVLKPGVVLHSHVVLAGRLTLGAGVEVFPFASIGQKTQDLKYAGGVGTVVVGDRTILREYVTIHQPTFADGLTSLGGDCAILAYSHIAHDCRVGNGVIMSNGVQLAGHVEVGDYAVIGGMAGVHQFCRVGTMSMIGACAKLVMDAVPYCLFDGVPATPRAINKINLQRRGADAAAMQAMSSAYRIVFRSGLAVEDAANRLLGEFPDNQYVTNFVDFIRKSERGIARPAGK